MNTKITSVTMGFGDGSEFFTTNPNAGIDYRCDEIKEEKKTISTNFGNGDTEQLVYVGYLNGYKKFEMFAGQGVTVRYETEI